MTRVVELVSPTADDTRAIAATIAEVLAPGDVVGLSGELGAGKTCFVQGAAAALGVRERVTSPSFLLRREYDGRLPVLHFDVYRLDTLAEINDLGYDDALAGDHVTFIEWSDAMSPLLPPERLDVELRLAAPDAPVAADGAEPRRVRLCANGDSWARRLAALEDRLARWRADGEG
ncbi:MAG TPA: tRNA (adenosine(37)-N6)-threonylcarbamoyltransferase complex ATPase subunit type 1 TsaE [Egibacteraceae bacterium]